MYSWESQVNRLIKFYIDVNAIIINIEYYNKSN